MYNMRKKNLMKRVPLFTRFWNKVEKTDSCWIWKGKIQSHGYGEIYLDGKPLLAHRVAFWLINKHWPEQANHKCNVNCCVRPDENHVIDGDNSSNQIDSIINGTHNFVKLRLEQVKEIKDSTKLSQYELACKYGVSQPLISAIKSGRVWWWL